jgi:cytochrome b subunit of formate dehydrogenase
MDDVLGVSARARDTPGHARWVRISHGIATVSLLTLAFSGLVILMAHPRLYWGDPAVRQIRGVLLVRRLG